MGEALKSGVPGSVRSSVICLSGNLVSPAWQNLEYSLKTGKPAFDKHYDKGLFEQIQETPGLAEMFSDFMVGLHGQEPPAVAEAYDFSEFETLVDVGGASGNMLGYILSTHSGPSGVLFDLLHVVQDAPALLANFGVQDRVSLESGSFFEGVPKSYDAYLLSHIIHDWDDADCGVILGHCRDALKPSGKILIVEMVLPESNEPHPSKTLDMMMLVDLDGQERTPTQYGELLAANGFEMTRIVPTRPPVSIIEAIPA